MSWSETPAEKFRARCEMKKAKYDDQRTLKILNQLKEDLDMALIKAKAQLEYVDDDEPCSCRTCDMIARGYEENA